MAKRGTDAVWQGIRRKLVLQSNAHVRVGILQGGKGDQKTEDGTLTMAQLGAIHEYGAPRANIPERSFIRRTFEEKRDKFVTITADLAEKLLTDKAMTVGKALGRLGMIAATEVKKTITAGPHIPPPLAPSTVNRKGSDRPLVDTGRLMNSITYEVVNNR